MSIIMYVALVAAEVLVCAFTACIAAAVCRRQKKIKRRAWLRARRRKRRQTAHEDKCQSKLARQIWALEDKNAAKERELSAVKAKQTITINGIGAVKLSEILTSCAVRKEARK